VANVEAYSRCCNAIEDMGKKLWALPCSQDANIGDMIKVLFFFCLKLTFPSQYSRHSKASCRATLSHYIINIVVICMKQALDTAVAEYEASINGPMKWQKLSSFLRERFSLCLYTSTK